jgi:hypothetical protein
MLEIYDFVFMMLVFLLLATCANVAEVEMVVKKCATCVCFPDEKETPPMADGISMESIELYNRKEE